MNKHQIDRNSVMRNQRHKISIKIIINLTEESPPSCHPPPLYDKDICIYCIFMYIHTCTYTYICVYIYRISLIRDPTGPVGVLVSGFVPAWAASRAGSSDPQSIYMSAGKKNVTKKRPPKNGPENPGSEEVNRLYVCMKSVDIDGVGENGTVYAQPKDEVCMD